MILDFFGLKEAPFSITPDPRFVFLSERHRDALAHLLYGIGKGGSGGFVLLTGEVGTGKTTVCRLLLEQLPEHTQVAMVLNPKISPVELLETIAEELKLDIEGARGSTKMLIDRLTHYLLDAYAQGLRVVLIIDEAQNLSIDALEQVRLLTNLETPTQKLLQILLLGQPELRELLAKPELRQLRQRITARYHLTPLSYPESEAYLRHRLTVAGSKRFPFSDGALKALHRRAQGVPRLLNVIADRALTASYAREQVPIPASLLNIAADEVLGERRHFRYWRYAFAALALIAVTALVGPRLYQESQTVAARPAPVAVTPPPDLDALLSKHASTRADDERQLLTTILKAWNADANLADKARNCPERIDSRLRCLRGRSNLTQLKFVGRPVLLLLRHRDSERWARLRAIGADSVSLDLGSERADIARTDLEKYWFGDFLGVFTPAVAVDEPLGLNASGPDVTWLHLRLRAFDELPIPPAPLYDAATESRVLALQKRYGLREDGVVGTETLWLLMAMDPSGPKLR